MGGKANRRVNPAARRTGRKEVRLMWSSSAILALNETRIFIATVNAILTPALIMSIYKTWTCRWVNIKTAADRYANITYNTIWV